METIKDSLEMTFQAEEGDNVKVTLYDQKSDLTAETVQEAMMNVVDMEALVKQAGENVYTIFNPLCYAYMRAHPFFHEFYGSKLKNNITFLRVNDGLFCERKPMLPGRGNAEIKELASILLSRSFAGCFSFTDYFGQMSWEDMQEYITAFKTKAGHHGLRFFQKLWLF